MELVVDEWHPGTDERTWLGSRQLAELPPLCPTRPRRLVVVAPHPDDEVLGAGGLLQYMDCAGVETVVVAVTDGEASHPAAGAQGDDLPAIRAAEARVALERLGCQGTRIQRLGFPDGAVADRLHELTGTLSRLLRPDDLCLTPWRSEGHADHEATSTATIAAARMTCTSTLEYLVWTWHWATPDSGVIPWSQCRRLDLGRRQTARKRWATYAYASQIRPLGDAVVPILADSVMRRFWRPFEVFIAADL
jgi:LmbE family N-acetylglucosaminyl deacetylase